MATSLASHSLNVQSNATTQQTVAGIAVQYPVSPNAFRSNLTDGVGAGMANDQTFYTGTVTAGAPVTLDLTSLTGPFGTVTFTAIKELIIYNDSTTDGQYLTINATGSNLFSKLFGPSSQVHPGPGIALSHTPTSTPPAVDGTHKNLVIDVAVGTAVPFRIAIRGLH